MLNNKKKWIENITKNDIITIFWTDTNIDFVNLLFKNEENILTYYPDDKVLSNYNKLTNFFNSNKNMSNGNNFRVFLMQDENIKFRIIGYLFNIFKTKFFRLKNKYENHCFNDQELNIMCRLAKSSKKEIIYIINNIQYANLNDIIFFKKLNETNFMKKYCKNKKILLFSNSNSINNIDLSQIKNNRVFKIELNNLEIIELCEKLKLENDIKDIDNEKISQYLKLCNFNYELVNQIIKITLKNKIDTTNINEKFIEHIYLILSKLPNLDLLEIAAVIGLSFDIFYIKEIKEIDLQLLVNDIEQAYKNGILLKTNNEYNYLFIDDLIRKLIYKKGSNNELWHLKYANILEKYNPEEYLLIAKQYLKIKKNFELALFYFSSLFISTIDNKKIDYQDIEIQEMEQKINENFYYKSLLYDIKQLCDKIEKNDFTKEYFLNCSFNTDFDFIELLFNYFKITLLYLLRFYRTEDEYKKIGDYFEVIIPILQKHNLNGLVIRTYFYLIDIYSYRINELSKAKKLYINLMELVKPILSNNNDDSNDLKIKIIRKTCVMQNAEVAYNKTKSLLPLLLNNNHNINHVEVYKFLSDHLGYALYSGHYYDVDTETYSLANEYLLLAKNLKFIKYYKLENNLFLLKLFNNNLNIKDAKKFLKLLKNQNNTTTMVNYNIAALSIYCSDFKVAEKILLKLLQNLQNNDNCFHYYCINANLASLYLLKMDYINAKKYNDNILYSNYEWHKDFINIMKERARIFAEYINNKKKLTPLQLFNSLNNEIKFSNTWLFLGRGIIFSELMFYRE